MTTGRLAIWNDCAPGREAEYEAWYQGEHLLERLAIPGFRTGRRFRAVAGTPEYFTWYALDTPEVLSSTAYLERVENPTPVTRQIMTEVFRNMSRTACRAVCTAGRMHGAFAVTCRNGTERLPEMAPDIARAELWQASGTGPSASAESRLRGKDETIRACLMVETLSEAAARRIASALPDGEIGIYRLICSLDAIP